MHLPSGACKLILAMDLSTTYLGLSLKHPIVPSASPLSRTLDSIKQLEDAGAPAIVMYSLFEEQIEQELHLFDHYRTHGTESYAESLSYFPDIKYYNVEPEQYVNLIRQAKESTGIPIIGSLNGTTTGGWAQYARAIEQAGADGLEINLYFIPTSLSMTGAKVEQRYVDILRDVKNTVRIPVAMKLSPFFSAPAEMARRLAEAGADALVLFNRFYQPDLDLESLEVVPHLVLSDSDELRLPLRWVAILFGRLKADLAITSGVHTAQDVLKGLMAGANVTMMTSALLKHGPQHLQHVVNDMTQWLEQHEYESVKQMIGSMSQKNVAMPEAFVRANYMKVLDSWTPAAMQARINSSMTFDDDQVISER